MGSKVKNVTFSLPGELIEKYKEYADSNILPSLNAGVREALEEYAKKIDKERLKKEMLKASEDPLFIQDIKETMTAFEGSDKESAGGIGR